MKALWATLTAVSALFVFGGGAQAADELRPRATFPKPVATTIDPEHHSTREVVVKFHEGTHIRLRDGRLVFDAEARSDEERARMKRHGLTDERVLSDVDRANELLFERANGIVGNVFGGRDEPESERSELEEIAGEELADLGLYFKLVLDEPDRALAEETIDALNALRSVEIAYAESLPAEPATDIAPPTTINLVPNQGYLLPAFRGGIDADWAWRLPGGRGAGIRVEDVEDGWDKDHEDLPGTYFAENGWNSFNGSHGAAVLGVLAAGDNAFGATGIVPDVTLGLSSPIWADAWSPHSTAAAVDNAAAALRPGDILVIEQHYPAAMPPGASCSMCGSQAGYLPAENVQAVYDAVRRATARGIVVVEAAGNGGMNLDDPFYNNRFTRSVRDSGAILVGAGSPNSPSAQVFTNFGSRVDLQGWGSNVATLGYGGTSTTPDPSLRANGSDAKQWYTRSFSGTSSATPIVAGAAAAVNGWRLADGEPLYDSIAMRQWLVATGTAQAGTKQIGPLPDLRRAMPAVAGRVDEVRADGVARGWAFHSTQPATSVGVHFYVDGPAGAGAWGGSATANVGRPDVNSYFNITGSHGFEHRIPDAFRDDANHTLYAYGIDPTGQRNRELEQRLVFNLPNVNGAIDSIDANGRVRGWAYAAQSPSQSITVHLYADGPRTGGGTWVGSYVANASRPDVNAAFGISGSHGLELQLPSQLGDGKQHVLYVYGIDPRGINNPLLGTKGFSWLDSDLDGFGDNVDNCPSNHNPSQTDFDNDGLGDPCDDDDDGDGALENVWPFDNCVRLYNPDQKDTDGDGYGDACDPTPNGPDTDGDGDPDATDPDDDGDSVLDAKDNCQYVKNTAQTDIDGDGVGTSCDPDEFVKAGVKTMGALKVQQEYFAKFERFEIPVFPCLEPSCGPLVLTIDVHLDIDLPMRIVNAEGRVLVEAAAGHEKVLKLEIDSPIEGNEPEHSEPRYFLEILRSPKLEPDHEYRIAIEARSEEHQGG